MFGKDWKESCCYPTANESDTMLAVWERLGQGKNGAVVWPRAGWDQVGVGADSRLWRDFVDHPVAAGAASRGCAVEMFVAAVEDQIVAGAVTVGAFKAVQHGVAPFAVGLGRHFENHATGAGGISSRGRGAVEVAEVIEGHATDRRASVCLKVGKVV